MIADAAAEAPVFGWPTRPEDAAPDSQVATTLAAFGVARRAFDTIEAGRNDLEKRITELVAEGRAADRANDFARLAAIKIEIDGIRTRVAKVESDMRTSWGEVVATRTAHGSAWNTYTDTLQLWSQQPEPDQRRLSLAVVARRRDIQGQDLPHIPWPKEKRLTTNELYTQLVALVGAPRLQPVRELPDRVAVDYSCLDVFSRPGLLAMLPRTYMRR